MKTMFGTELRTQFGFQRVQGFHQIGQIERVKSFEFSQIGVPSNSSAQDSKVANAHRSRSMTETDRLGLSFELHNVSVGKYTSACKWCGSLANIIENLFTDCQRRG